MNAILIGGTGATGRCMMGSLLQAKASSNEMFLVGVRIGCKQTMVLGRVLGASLVHASMVHVAKYIGSNFSRIASGTIATPTTDYIATSILHHIFIMILALY